MFAVLPYTFHWSLGLRVVFIRNECLMSALKSYLSGLNMLVARLWKWLYAEKGPVEYCLSTLLHLVAVFSEGFCVVLVGSSFGRGECGEEMTPFILFDLHCPLTPGAGVCCLSVHCRDRKDEGNP